jgi:Zn-dependent protease with chaperone function
MPAHVTDAGARPTRDLTHVVKANRRRALFWSLCTGFLPGAVAGVIIGVVLGAIGGLVAAVLACVVVAVTVWGTADGVVRRIVGACLADAEAPETARLANLVEGLCATLGVRPPALWVVDEQVPNAMALGRRPGDAVLIVTTGILRSLGLIELEGVVAHELSHVKRGDTVVSGVIVTALLPLARIGAARGLHDRMLHAVVGRGREYRADQMAVRTVRYPPGLHDALAQLCRAGAPEPGSLFGTWRAAATRWLWIDPMVGRHDERPAAGDLDATGARVAALAEL